MQMDGTSCRWGLVTCWCCTFSSFTSRSTVDALSFLSLQEAAPRGGSRREDGRCGVSAREGGGCQRAHEREPRSDAALVGRARAPRESPHYSSPTATRRGRDRTQRLAIPSRNEPATKSITGSQRSPWSFRTSFGISPVPAVEFPLFPLWNVLKGIDRASPFCAVLGILTCPVLTSPRRSHVSYRSESSQ